jgi:dihydroorotate dehydrogenase (NAD+) catalytic subunit
MSIELAPHNKVGLRLASRLIAGSGAAGFGNAWPPGVGPEMFGALVTAPLSLRPRRGQAPPRIAEVPGGYLLATADHNPGYNRVVRDHAKVWSRIAIPVIAALAAKTPGDWARLAAHLEEETAIAGLELALPGDVAFADAHPWIAAVRRAAALPLLVKLPATRAEEWARPCAEAGVDALVLGTPPVAAFPAADGMLVVAPVGGPAALPFTLQALQAVARLDLGLPLVAAGGIHDAEDARLCLETGASAVQVRGLMWADPAAAARLAAIMQSEAGQDSQSTSPTASATA